MRVGLALVEAVPKLVTEASRQFKGIAEPVITHIVIRPGTFESRFDAMQGMPKGSKVCLDAMGTPLYQREKSILPLWVLLVVGSNPAAQINKINDLDKSLPVHREDHGKPKAESQ